MLARLTDFGARTRWWGLLPAMLIAVGVIFWSYQHTTAQDAAKSAGSVAVVDLESVVTQLQEQQQFRDDLDNRRRDIAQRQEEENAAIQKLQNELKVLKVGGDKHRLKQDELAQQVIEFNAWLQFEQQRLQRDSVTHFMKLYRMSTASATEIAKARGFEVLLYRQGEPDWTKVNPKDLSTVIQNRKVLWSSPDTDLTDQVIQQMNTAFQNRGG